MKILIVNKQTFKKLLKEYFEYHDSLEEYFEYSNPLKDKTKQQIRNMILKLTEEAKKTIVKEIDVIFYIKNENSFINEPTISKIDCISNEAKLYLYYFLIEWFEEYYPDEVKLMFKETGREEIETINIINATIFAINYTQGETGFTLDAKKIDSLYSKSPNNIAKGAKKSIITTLTNKKKRKQPVEQ